MSFDTATQTVTEGDQNVQVCVELISTEGDIIRNVPVRLLFGMHIERAIFKCVLP